VLYETDGKIGLDCLEDIIEEPFEQENQVVELGEIQQTLQNKFLTQNYIDQFLQRQDKIVLTKIHEYESIDKNEIIEEK